MKTIKLSIVAFLSLFSVAHAAENINKAPTLVEQQEESLVKSIIPSTKVEKVTRAEFDGFYKAYLANGNIMYINPFKRLIFIGEIYTTNGQNITANDRISWQKERSAELVKQMTKEEMIKDAVKVDFGKGSKKYEFVIFTDPECPFCKDAEEFFAKNDVTVYVNFFPSARHTNAKKLSLQALSSKGDFKKHLNAFHQGTTDLNEKISVNAEAQLQKMVDLGMKIGVLGTPAIFVVEKSSSKLIGEIQGGANIPEIEAFIKKDKE